MKIQNKKMNALILMFLSVILVSVMHFSVGIGNISPVIFRIRMVIFAEEIMIAMVLAMGGLILQTLLLNPLAEPYLIGVSSGASFGAVLAVFLSLSPLIFFRTGMAVGGSLLLSMIILMLSFRRGSFSIGIAILAGVGFNALFSNGIMLIQSLLRPNDYMSSIGWIMGNVDVISVPELILLFFAFICELIFLLKHADEMDIYLSGDEMAMAVGVDTSRIKFRGFMIVSLSTGIVVSIAGMIGFIGLIVPHIVRLMIREKTAKQILPVCLTSSLVIMTAGILSRNILPGTVIPIGVMTSLIGAPVFIYLLVRQYKGI